MSDEQPSSADICRANGWTVGTVIEGRESFGRWWHESRLLITAIGEQEILGREIAVRSSDAPDWHDAGPASFERGPWLLRYRDWHAVPGGEAS